jgi:hypothetical protein
MIEEADMSENLISNMFRKALAPKRWWSGIFVLFIIVVVVITTTGCMPQAQACCQVINVAQNTITARDIKTGRTFQFQIDQMDGINLKIGDTIGADLTVGNVTSVKGIAKTYKAFEPDNAEPCCEIVSIQPDPAEPCCEIISAKNNATGTTFQFDAEGVRLLSSLTVGQAVNVIGSWAAVQSSVIPGLGNLGATFSFAISPVK